MFEQWKITRIQLSSAIQTFCDASSALNWDIARSISTYPDRSNLEIYLEELDAELSRLSADTKSLDEECAKLSAARNSSEQVVLISKLPVDVLSRIFAILAGWGHIHCDLGLRPDRSQKDATSYPVVLSSVCSAWRHIIVNTPLFWSHIDLSVAFGRYSLTEYTRLCAQRAKATPIDLHILCEEGFEPFETGEAERMAALPEILRNRTLTSLNLALYRQDSVHPILLAWVNNFSNLTSLSVRLYSHRRIETALFPESSDRDLLYSQLSRLHTLDLRKIRLDWNQATFSGLVNLSLSNIEPNYCPTIDQLRSMLIASPGLRTIQLHSVVLPMPDSRIHGPIQPIYLEELTLLCFDCIPAGQMLYWLRTIAPGKGPLCLNVKPRTSEGELTLQVLASCGPAKYNVRTLSLHMQHSNLDGFGPQIQLGLTLALFKHVQTLNLSYVPLCGNQVIDIICAQPGDTLPGVGEMSHNSNFRQLRLQQCCLTAHGMRRIVSSHRISWLRMDQCHVHEGTLEEHPSTFVPLRSNIPDDLRLWLGNKVLELYIDHKFKVESNCGHVVAVTDKGLPWWLSPFEG